MMWILYSYPTTVLNERMSHFRGRSKHTLTPSTFFFLGVRTPNPRFYARSSVVSRVQQLSVAEWVIEWVSEWLTAVIVMLSVLRRGSRYRSDVSTIWLKRVVSPTHGANSKWFVYCVQLLSLCLCPCLCLCLYCHVLLSLCLRLVSSPATANYKSTSSKSESKSKSLIAVCTDSKINTL